MELTKYRLGNLQNGCEEKDALSNRCKEKEDMEDNSLFYLLYFVEGKIGDLLKVKSAFLRVKSSVVFLFLIFCSKWKYQLV